MTTNVEEATAVDREMLLTAEEAADQLRVKPSWMYRAAKEGYFPSVPVGRYVRFRQGDVTDWIRNGGRGDE
jgi:excisionase family DNA binding protein